MTYITSSNAVGVPGSLIIPDNLTGAGFNPADGSTHYTAATFAGQKNVVDGTIAAFAALPVAPSIAALDAIDANSVAGDAEYRAAFAAVLGIQGVGIAPIASSAQTFTANNQASWSSTDPKLTIDYKDDNGMTWFTYATGFKGGGWQFANYFEELVRSRI